MGLVELARKLRPFIEKAAQGLTESEGLQAKELYPKWEQLVTVGLVSADEGFKFTYNGDLYKCVNANPTFSAEWVPGVGTEALYVRIDETHAGTIDDPIPYAGNMTLEVGKYYTQNGAVYMCTRDSENPVYHNLIDLVGLYVEEVGVE